MFDLKAVVPVSCVCNVVLFFDLRASKGEVSVDHCDEKLASEFFTLVLRVLSSSSRISNCIDLLILVLSCER